MASPLSPEAAAAASEILQRSDRPQSLPQIRRQLAGSFRVPPKQEPELKALLESTAGIYQWPGSRFWSRDPTVVVESALFDAVQDGPAPRSALNKALSARVKGYPVAARNERIEELLRQGRLYEDPPWGGRGVLLSATKPDSERYRPALEEQLAPILAKYAAAGLDPRPVVDRICGQISGDLAQRILDALSALEPRKGLVVSAHRLRRAPELTGVSKDDFDRAVMGLFAQRRIFLHDHGAPFAVQAGEREELVTDGKGRFYVGIAWRDSGESAGSGS